MRHNLVNDVENHSKVREPERAWNRTSIVLVFQGTDAGYSRSQ
jgi:hypothetical protein